MENTKHTEGPWKACHDGECSCGMVWSSPCDFVVATATSTCKKDEGVNLGDGISNKSETFKANVKLIAAAPDLLKELQHLVRLLEPLEKDGGLDVPGLATLNGARAAIKKATE